MHYATQRNTTQHNSATRAQLLAARLRGSVADVRLVRARAERRELHREHPFHYNPEASRVQPDCVRVRV